MAGVASPHPKESDLSAEKTLATLDRARLSPKLPKNRASRCEGGFCERGESIVAFGLPGRGKTNIVCAIGHELIRRNHRVLLPPTYALVQRSRRHRHDEPDDNYDQQRALEQGGGWGGVIVVSEKM